MTPQSDETEALNTRIAVHTADGVTVRGRDLVEEIVGHRTFTEMLYFLVCKRDPSTPETKVLDACLVMLMENGINVSTLVTRLMALAVPGEPQVAMGVGLMTVGDVFAGSADGCGRILATVVAENENRRDATCQQVVNQHRSTYSPVPGFGHGTHVTDDPRATRLLDLARGEPETRSDHIDALMCLSRAVDQVHGRHIPINVTGAMAAILLDIGVPLGGLRGIAVVARCGGVLGHVLEEHDTQSTRHVWRAARDRYTYVDQATC